MKISIALATYNGARFLAEQLDSFAAQSRLPDELIVSDDSSTDETLSICRAFAATAPFAVAVRPNPDPRGFSRNFERAISLATGDIILLSDQDDIWYPDKILTVETALRDHPEMLTLHHDEHILDQATGRRFPRTVGENNRVVRSWDRILEAGNCTALRKDLAEILMPFPTDLPFDQWIAWVGTALDSRLVLDVPLQLWRRHGSNSSTPFVAEEAPSQWQAHRRFGRSDPRPGWIGHNQRWQVVRDRISDRKGAIDALLGSGRADQAIDRINAQIAALDRRIALLNLPRSQRWMRVAALYGSGFYRGFSGYKSALKDATRS